MGSALPDFCGVTEAVLVCAVLHGPIDKVFGTQTQSETAEGEDGIKQAIFRKSKNIFIISARCDQSWWKHAGTVVGRR